ncbi:MAG: N-methyltransferase [Gammaproteobacteria bacterium]|jgi:leader peptidase (prepilin peptidase)/N-methyltransferase|nr:N-methyltransferase [Gammaproteobacteria bacterium]
MKNLAWFLLINIVLLALMLWRFGYSWQLLTAVVFAQYLLILSLIDYYTGLLPDILTLSLLWLGLLLNSFHMVTNLYSAVTGAMLGYVSLWLLYWIFKLLTGKEGMGYGDFKLLGAIGAWLGWQALIYVVLIASMLSLFAVLLNYCVRGSWQASIPFGPGLALAGLLVYMQLY